MGFNFSVENWLLFSLLVILGMASAAGCQKVPAMYVFGDSLVDVGNNNYLNLSLAKANFPHNGIDFAGQKATGRFSNGKNTADFLAEKAGVATPPPYLSFVSNKSNTGFPTTGVSFASGGAGIFNSTGELFKQVIPLTKQVEYFSIVQQNLVRQLGSAAAQVHLSNSIFAVLIGSNDISEYLESDSDLPKKITPQQYVGSMALALKDALKKLHSFGARKYVIAGIGQLGCCPSQRIESKTEECNEEDNYWPAKYNEGLKSMLQGLKSELKGMVYSYLDIYAVFSGFFHSPSTHGFSEVKAACCGSGILKAQVPCLPTATYCSNRSDHIFWDLSHPTEAAARLFVDTVFDGSRQYADPVNLKQLISA